MKSWNHCKVRSLFRDFIVLASNSRSIAAHKTALAEEQAKKEEAIKKHEEEVKALEGTFYCDGIPTA